MNLIKLVLVSSICTGVVTASIYRSGSVYCHKRNCTFRRDVLDIKGSTAYGVYNDTLFDLGWGKLDIRSGSGKPASNDDIMYAAGYIEGVLTSWRIYENHLNLKPIFIDSQSEETVNRTREFFQEQDKWIKKMIEVHGGKDPLWRQMSYIMAQLDGLVKGYNSVAPPSQILDLFNFQIMSASGDLMDIMQHVNKSLLPDWDKMSESEIETYILSGSRCSALVKVTDNYDDLHMGHSTWFMYQSMMRIYKFWTFLLEDEATQVTRMSFSSYPGFLVSIDDFYVMADTSMVMLQTTNSIFNNSLSSFIKPQSLLAWHRVRVANMMANSGSEWADAFSPYNSGTYPNQYMIIDLKLFDPAKALNDNLLWVVEQIPTLVVAADQTDILREGYWASYNVPFYEEIYNMSGYPDFVAKHGTDYSYQLAPRAKIFRRDHGKVHSINTMQKILRYNDYLHDPFSEGDSCKTICCRGDLRRKENQFPGGCIDTKVTDFASALECSAFIVNGPTTDSGLPPFSWEGPFQNVSHIGLPDWFDFHFIHFFPGV